MSLLPTLNDIAGMARILEPPSTMMRWPMPLFA